MTRALASGGPGEVQELCGLHQSRSLLGCALPVCAVPLDRGPSCARGPSSSDPPIAGLLRSDQRELPRRIDRTRDERPDRHLSPRDPQPPRRAELRAHPSIGSASDEQRDDGPDQAFGRLRSSVTDSRAGSLASGQPCPGGHAAPAPAACPPPAGSASGRALPLVPERRGQGERRLAGVDQPARDASCGNSRHFRLEDLLVETRVPHRHWGPLDPRLTQAISQLLNGLPEKRAGD